MSDEEKPERSEPKPGTYPLKYWWVVLVALPVLLGLLKLVPELRSKKSAGGGPSTTQRDGGTVVTGAGNILNSDLSTKNYVINLATIEKEYVAAKNEPLSEEIKAEIASAIALLEEGRAAESAAAFEKLNEKVSLPALQTDLGVAYQKAGNAKEATKAFHVALGQNPTYAPAHHNLGIVKTSRGELPEALGHFAKAGDVGESKAFVSAIDVALETRDYEVEPNNDAAHANLLPLAKAVQGNIAQEGDADFFRLSTPEKYRDILQVEIENKSANLRPVVNVFDANKSRLHGDSNATPNANLTHAFSIAPGTTYFLEVGGGWSSTGRYAITARPMKRYDTYEPNPDILNAATIELGKEVTADIMDNGDLDYYRFQAGANGTTARMHIENTSATLKPVVSSFDRNKSRLGSDSNGTAGANLDYAFPLQPNAVAYVCVSGGWDSTGSYTLIVNQE